MFRVCMTAPIDGMARYASRCSALFHMNVRNALIAVNAQLPQRARQPGRPLA